MTNKLYSDGKGPSYTYTPDGKLARRTWARGIVTEYTYDNAVNPPLVVGRRIYAGGYSGPSRIIAVGLR